MLKKFQKLCEPLQLYYLNSKTKVFFINIQFNEINYEMSSRYRDVVIQGIIFPFSEAIMALRHSVLL